MTEGTCCGEEGGEQACECIEFTGEEVFLPVGYQIRSPGIMVLDFVQSFRVVEKGQIKDIDPWGADGFPGKVIGVTVNNEAIDAVQALYGGRGIVVQDANGNRLTVPEWKEKYGTNPIALLAISRAYLATTGPGVQTYRAAGTKFGLDAKKVAGAGQSRTDLGNRQPVKLGRY